MPSITPGARSPPQHRGGQWPMGAASHRPHARSLRPMGSVSPRTPHKQSGQIPCQHFVLHQPRNLAIYPQIYIANMFLSGKEGCGVENLLKWSVIPGDSWSFGCHRMKLSSS